MPRFRTQPIVLMIVKITMFFLGGASFATFLVYEIGILYDFPEFMEVILLRGLTIEGVCLGIGSCYGLLLNAFLLFRRKIRQYIAGIIGYIFLGAFGFTLAALSAFFRIITDM
ncbi:hypothetical protein FACS1894172_12030 [Spirochaetia bacterium]|nr:hypothetical protein FACS1894164_01800 [Spirochaetia bacterium]GHU33462.1 hypothetical protein FACS1894172_12030 [Spirochaetia bacterium]